MTEERLKEIEILAEEKGDFLGDFDITHVNELIHSVRDLRLLLSGVRGVLDQEVAGLPCEASVYTMDDLVFGELMFYRDLIDARLKK